MCIYNLRTNKVSTPELTTQIKKQKIVSILEVSCMLFPDSFTQEITTILIVTVITPLLYFSIFTTSVCNPKQHTIFCILYKWNFPVCTHPFSIFCSILVFLCWHIQLKFTFTSECILLYDYSTNYVVYVDTWELSFSPTIIIVLQTFLYMSPSLKCKTSSKLYTLE